MFKIFSRWFLGLRYFSFALLDPPIYCFQSILKNCSIYSSFASLLYYCTSCSRGFDLERKKQQNSKHEQHDDGQKQEKFLDSVEFFIREDFGSGVETSFFLDRMKKKMPKKYEALLS